MTFCKHRWFWQMSSNPDLLKTWNPISSKSPSIPTQNLKPRTENRESLLYFPRFTLHASRFFASRLTPHVFSLHASRFTFYSYLSASTGLVLAVLIDCQVTAANAIANAINIASAYIHQLILVR